MQCEERASLDIVKLTASAVGYHLEPTVQPAIRTMMIHDEDGERTWENGTAKPLVLAWRNTCRLAGKKLAAALPEEPSAVACSVGESSYRYLQCFVRAA